MRAAGDLYDPFNDEDEAINISKYASLPPFYLFMILLIMDHLLFVLKMIFFECTGFVNRFMILNLLADSFREVAYFYI